MKMIDGKLKLFSPSHINNINLPKCYTVAMLHTSTTKR